MKKSIAVVLCLVLFIAALTATFAACNSKSITVTYMDGDKVLKTQQVKVGETFTLYTPTKENAKFVNWYLDKDFINVYVEDKVMAELTLYAKFEAASYYVIIRTAGGELPADQKQVNVTPGEAYTLPVPTREGFVFTGYTYDNGTDEVSFPVSGTYNLTDTIRVTANWAEAKYTVNFKDGDTVLYTTEASHGANVSYTTSKEGYTFIGWTDDKGVAYPADKTSFQITENVDFTARFEANGYTITVNTAGGETIQPIAVTYGTAYTVPAAVKQGYTFAGYTFEGEAFAATGTYTYTRNIYVTATYTQNTVTVRYSAEGEVTTETINQYAKATAKTAPEKVGYTFAYWAAEENGNAAFDFDTAIAQDVTLYAVYTVNEYAITVENLTSANQTVAYGATYTLPAEPALPEWAIAFNGYTLRGEAFEATGTYTWTTSITVVANFERDPMYNKSEVTVYVGNNTPAAVWTVEDGTTVEDKLDALNTAKEGYTFRGWSTKADEYTAYDKTAVVNANVTLYAFYDANEYHVYVMDGSTQLDAIAVTYDANYAIDTTEYVKRGYTYSRLTLGGETFATSGKYTTAGDTTVYVEFTQNKVTVTFLVEGTPTEREINQYAKVTAIASPVKVGYNFVGWSTNSNEYVAFDFDAEIEADVNVYAIFAAKTLMVKVVRWNTTDTLTATYGVDFNLANPDARNGYQFTGYTMDDEAFSGLVVADFDKGTVFINENWKKLNADQEADETDKLFVDKGTYFKERNSLSDDFTFVFLTAGSYNLKGITAISGAGDYIDVTITETGAKLDVKQNVGAFEMSVTKLVDGTPFTYTRQVKVVNNVTMNYGTDYTNIWVNNTQSGTANFQVARKQDSVMAAGVNNFVFDVNIITNGGSSETPSLVALPFAQANVDVMVKEGEQVVADNLYNVNAMTGAINFDGSLTGKTVTVTLTPKYAAAANVKTFKLALNDGVNVYTNADLKSRYSDLSVHQINILRNIKAELVADDYIAGHGKNIQDVALKLDGNDLVMEGVDTGTPQNDYAHGVYTRFTTDATDTMRINGNFFAIDGSKLPYIDNRYDQYGASGSKFTTGDSFRIANVQIGIFLYRNATLDLDGSTLARYCGGTLTMDNLLVEGNNVEGLSGASQDLVDGKVPLLKMSAAYLGIVCRGGTVNLDNVHVKKTSIALFTDGGIDGYTGNPEVAFNADKHAVVVNAKNCRMTENWANDVYGYNLTKFTFTNTKLAHTAGGAAIAFDDKYAAAADANLQCELNMDYDTASNIQNWVTGQEAWFVAYGQSSTALWVKTEINNNVSGNGMTDLDKTGQMMNFAIFARSAGNYDNSDWDSDPQGAPSIKLNIIDIPAGLIQYAMPQMVEQVAQANGISEEQAAAAISQQMAAGGIGCWTDGKKTQLYLEYGLGERNGKMIVGIPLYIPGTQPQ